MDVGLRLPKGNKQKMSLNNVGWVDGTLCKNNIWHQYLGVQVLLILDISTIDFNGHSFIDVELIMEE